jgi:hypothetical protein
LLRVDVQPLISTRALHERAQAVRQGLRERVR